MVTAFSINFSNQIVTELSHLKSKQQMTAQKDQEYIKKVLQGDMHAFAALVDHYKDLVFTLTLQMLKNKEEAEEVSQDTFLKVYKSLKGFKGDSKFSTWLYRITYNTCLDRLKKNKHYYQTVTIDKFTEDQIQTLDTILDDMEQQERKHAIQFCLQLLPNDDSFLITLYYFEELSLDEISKIIGLTANNVKVKLFRSRKKLMTILKERLEPELIDSYERKRR